MRPVSRPPWTADQSDLDAGDAAAFALGAYCSACEIPLSQGRTGWNAGTGRTVSGFARAREWDDLLLLCRHCARAASSRAPENRGTPLLPDRDTTFAPGPDAPFAYRQRDVEYASSDGGDPALAQRVLLVPNGRRASDTVELFSLNTAFPVDPGMRAALAGGPDGAPLSGEHRRRLIEFDDARLKLRTDTWRHARRSVELYREAESDAERVRWADLLALAVKTSGFWSVWASVLADAAIEPALVGPALAVRPAPVEGVRGAQAASWPLLPTAAEAFPATRVTWPPTPRRPEPDR